MKRILLVDDEPRVLDALRRMLRPMHGEWELVFAESFDQAMEALSGRETDAIVSDHNMPGRTGLDLLKCVRADRRHVRTPFLMLTGNAETQLLRDALDSGATDFLRKPCDAVELIARLKNVLALKEFQDQILRQNEFLEARVRERTRDLERSQRDIVFRLAKAAETRDADTGNHIIRVGMYSLTLAKALGMDKEFQERILLASPLHDVGKIGISDAILRKPGSLTPQERETMEQHCNIGADILTQELRTTFALLTGEEEQPPAANDLLEMAANIARCHHESWDGSGYPNGLAGVNIPIEARIVAVADVYDAMRSARAYKPAFTVDETVAHIRGLADIRFDPEVVMAMMSVLDEFERIRQELDDVAERERNVA